MLKDLVIERSGLRWADRVILYDIDGLLARCNSLSNDNYVFQWINSAEELRYIYERDYRSCETKGILVLSSLNIRVPFDIQRSFTILRLGFEEVFPQLDATTLRTASNVDFDYLAIAVKNLDVLRLDPNQTRRFYVSEMYNQGTVDLYSVSVRQRLESYISSCETYSDWLPIIDLLSKFMLLSYKGFKIDDFQNTYNCVDKAFSSWMAKKYQGLASSADISQPVMLHHIPDFIRRTSKKPAIIVIDGMSFVDWQLIKEYFSDESWKIDTRATFSFLPSVTSIARQSLFSGFIPAQNKNTFSLADEEKQWRMYWIENGLHDDEIFFGKTETPDISYKTKVAGIVVNFIDDLMHRQLLGTQGMVVDISEWLKTGSLRNLINNLIDLDFDVFITADHGHLEAIGKGRFSKPGLLTEDVSRRAVIYKDFAGAEELDKFNVVEFAGTYMPKTYRYFLFANGECIGDYGKKYITHGGDSIEEILVPFVMIGDAKNG